MMLRKTLRRTAVLGALMLLVVLAAGLASGDGDGVATRAPQLARSGEAETSLQSRPTAPAAPSTGWAPVGAARIALAPGAPTFGQPTISGIQGNGFEQALRIDPSDPNKVYTSAPGSLSSDTSWIWRSVDAGRTFKWVPNGIAKTGKVSICAGGGDTEIAVDPTGSVYFNDLTLANFSTARSDDAGVTFTCSNTGVPDAVVDRQWYAVDGDPKNPTPTGAPNPVTGVANTIYLTNDQIGSGGPVCPISGAGNNTLVMYRSPVAVGSSAGVQFGPSFKVTPVGSCLEGIMGNDEVSPVATTTGELIAGQPSTLANPAKHVYVIHDDATFSKIRIGRCFPVAFGVPVANTSDPSGLRCDDLLVADLGPETAVRTGGSFPTMAIDSVGNLYTVWEQAAVDGSGYLGNTSLYYAYSLNEGTTWSAPILVPTTGLLNNVFAWIAAGDDGKVDIAWYGTPAPTNLPGCLKGGPDSVNGAWSLWMIQTQNGHAASPTWTAPIEASAHPIHKGSIQTVMGGQCGNRDLGDFLNIRIGTQGEANVTYADSNSIFTAVPHAMFVRQNGGASVRGTPAVVTGDPILLNSATDPAGDGKYEANGTIGPNIPNLDILGSSMAQPAPAACNPSGTACYRVTMTVANLSTAVPGAASGDPDPDIVWSTQWAVPASAACVSGDACTTGGRKFHVYAESNNAGSVHCYVGENAAELLGGGALLTYPGNIEITGTACSFVPGAPGTITIDVPVSAVTLPGGVPAFNSTLYTVTAATMTLASQANLPPSLGGIGGQYFDLIDVVRAYNAEFGTTAVRVSSFSARRNGPAVVLRWQTATEAGLAGFHVFRQTGSKRVRLDRALIPARGGAQGNSYVWRTRRAPGDARYLLQAVGLDGAKRWFGPVRAS